MLYFTRGGTSAMAVVYRFGEFRLDCGRYELLRAERAVKIERKPMELLVLFTSRQGQLVTRSEIAERLWSNEVYVDTEHGINTAVRKLRITLRDDPAEPRFIKTVTGVGYRFVAPVITEPNTDVSEEPASAAALPSASSAGISEAPSPPASTSVQPSEGSALQGTPLVVRSRVELFRRGAFWLTGIAALVLLLGFLLIRRQQRIAAPTIRSLAVLPLDNYSGDPNQEYLASGMTDELITMIARNSTLRIPSRTSVMQYKAAHRPLSEIAHALGVDGIVEGSMARKGGRIHLTLQLIRSDTDSHIWAESFDRDANDTALAEEAAAEIAKQVHSVRPVITAQRYINPEAHDAYLRGKYLWPNDGMLASGEYFKKATQIQPDYAAAWAGLADYYGEGVAGDALDPRIALPQEEDAAKRALVLGPDLAEAHVAMAAAYLIARWDWANADIESQRAISLDPRDGELYYFRANVLCALKRKAEAIELARKSVELAPYERPTAIAEMLVLARRYDEAIAELRLRLVAMPKNDNLLYTLADTLRRKGDYKGAVDIWAQLGAAGGHPEAAKQQLQAYQHGGWRGELQWLLRQREKDAKSGYVSPVELAGYHAQLGEREPTLSLLEEGYRQKATDILWLQEDPAYDFLSADPQFRSIVRRIGEPAAP